MIETVQRFGSAARLVGVLTEGLRSGSPEVDGRPTVILLTSGLIHRVGPNRLYVEIAREVARAGFDCLRFDFSGIGDSSVRADALSFIESGVAETVEAMDHLSQVRGASRFILGGLCSGGYFAFRTALRDHRVAGLVLLNARGHLGSDDADEQQELHRRAMSLHYRRLALSPAYRWKNVSKVLRGQFDVRGAVAALLSRLRFGGEASDGRPIDTSAYDHLCDRGVRVLNVYSEGDWSLDYLKAALGGDPAAHLSRPGSRFELLRGANHVFSLRWNRTEVLQHVTDWMQETQWGDPESVGIPSRPGLTAPPGAGESVHDRG